MTSAAVTRYDTAANGKERFRCQQAVPCERMFILKELDFWTRGNGCGW